MKRKLITAVFAMAMGLVVVGTFGSCKDYEEDSINDLRGYQSQQLKKANEKLKADLMAIIEKIKSCDCDDTEVMNMVQALENQLEALDLGEGTIKDQILAALDLNAATDVMEQLKKKLGINEIIEDINNLKAIDFSGDFNDINKRIDSLASTTFNDSVRLNGINNALSGDLEHLRDSVKNLCDSVNNLRADLIALDKSAQEYTDTVVAKAVAELDDTINVRIDKLKQALETADSNLQSQITDLKDSIDVVAANVSALNTRVDSLESRIGKVETTLANLVTGILVQGTENPVFGSFALPLDMRSNVLMTYYGENTVNVRDYTFPAIGTDFSDAASDVTRENSFTEDEFALLDLTNKVMPISDSETLFDKEKGNAGTLYLTINPNTVNFSKLPVSLVNSWDVESGIKLEPLEKSGKKLTFGYTRSAADNGFYAAKATLDIDSIDKVKVNIEPGLKSEMKEVLEALQDRNLSSINFTDLAGVIYKQFNGILDANAVKTTWTDGNDAKHSVYSEYNIAATAFKPLSYTFLQDNNHKLPTISEIDDIDLGDFNVNLKLDTIHIDLSTETSLKFDSIKFDTDSIYVVVNTVKKGDNGDFVETTDTVNVEGLGDFIDELNKTVGGWSQEVNNELSNQLETIEREINAQLKDMIDDMNTQLGDVNELVDEMNGIEDQVNSYVDKVNSYISRVNSYINKINHYIKHANDYLQVTMLFEKEDGSLSQVSNSKGVGASRIPVNKETVLYLTSYTGELVVPAYKKFVAVTDIMRSTIDTGTSVKNGSIPTATLYEANRLESFNKVLPGSTRAVKFKANQKGLYEIKYSALDYSGHTSTRTFYIYAY